MVGGQMDQVRSCDGGVGQYESTSGRNVTGSGKFAFIWSDSGRLIPDVNSSDPGQLGSDHSNYNPGFKSEDMDSGYSETGDTFASLSCGDYSKVDASVSPCPAERSDENSRDFIMRRFLPAAQALTTEAASPALPPSVPKPSPFAHRVVPMLPRPNKTRFAQEVKLDEVEGSSGDGNEGERLGGFAFRLGKMTLKHLKYGFRTPTLTNKNPVSQKKLHDKISGIDSDRDLLISDDEEHCASEESNMKPPNKPNSKLKYLEQEGFSKDAVEIGFQRGNSFLSGNFKRTSHTLNSQGFLGLPKPTNPNREVAQGLAMDTASGQKMHIRSQGNYGDSHIVRINEHEEIEDSSHGPSTTSSSSADSPKEQLVGAVARREGPMLMPLPSLKSPSESWLCNTLPPASRFLAIKKMPQKALRRHPSHQPVRQIDQPLREVHAYENLKP